MAVSLLVWLLGWQVDKIKDLPAGLPTFQLPPLADLNLVPQLTGSAFAIALLGLLEALAIAKSIAARTRQPLDCNRQCLAEGLANLGGGFFQCLPGSGSLTRSSINYQAGAVTRLSGVFAAAAVAVTVLLFAWLAVHSQVGHCRHVDCHGLAAGGSAAHAFCPAGLALRCRPGVGHRLCGRVSEHRVFRPGRHLPVVFAGDTARPGCGLPSWSSAPSAVVRKRMPDNPRCTKMVLMSLEGELFFGAGPELAACFTDLTSRVDEGARVLLLRVKRPRNPDMVCMELLLRFLRDMQARGVTVLLCGVREDFAAALHKLDFYRWLPRDCVFHEDGGLDSATLRAVHRAYELLGDDLCSTCPRRRQRVSDKGEWYYMI